MTAVPPSSVPPSSQPPAQPSSVPVRLPSPYDRWFAGSPIDGTYGYDRDALLAVTPAAEPDGFADLWRSWCARAREVPSDVVVEGAGGAVGGAAADPAVGAAVGRAVRAGSDAGDATAGDATAGAGARRRPTHDVSVVTYTADGGLRLRAWVAVPVGVPPRVGVVHSHGYGGRAAPTFERVPHDAAVIFPVARGLGALNTGVGAPDTSSRHVLHGIEAVETYAVGRSAVDLWHAATALLDLLAQRDAALGGLPLYFVGTSFGGGIGALAVPWDDRFVGATLEVPTFGQHDLRLKMPCTGSGEAVRHHVADHPEAREVLAFHDASVAATHLRVPTRVECAAWDTHVPPPGQFAVANGVARAAGSGMTTHPTAVTTGAGTAGTGTADTGAAGTAGAGTPGTASLELAIHTAGHAEYPGQSREQAAAFAATRAHIARTLPASPSPAAVECGSSCAPSDQNATTPALDAR